MNLNTLRTKRVLIPALATVAVLGAGGTAWAVAEHDTVFGDQVSGAERDRVAAAAVQAAGGGEAVDVETSDEPGEAYEVEVRTPDGGEVDVSLDADLAVVSRDRDDRFDDDNDDDTDERAGSDDRDDRDDRDTDKVDRAVSAQQRTAAERAARGAIPGARVLRVEADDDGVPAYEVTVLDSSKVLWEVDLDADFTVVGTQRED